MLLTLNPLTVVCPNAYESGRHDQDIYRQQTAYASMKLPRTQPRFTSLNPVPPFIDIVSFTRGTGPGPNGRGVLFVRDCLANGPPFQQGFFDLSPHDFRLASSVAPATLQTQNPIAPGVGGQLNPLVDQGWHLLPFQMVNAMIMDKPPGFLALNIDQQSNWPWHSWNEDCEGFGNPRIYDHPSYANRLPASLPEQFIDIGADELGELVVVGHRFGTTTFSNMTPLGLSQQDNKYMWYFGPPQSHTPILNADLRPHFTWAWPDCWGFNPAQPYYSPRKCEIVPHLLPDIHPWWSGGPNGNQPPSNCLWQWWQFPTTYNWTLFVSPLAGVVNPPGTYQGIQGFFRWLDGSSPTVTQWQPAPDVGPPGPTGFTQFGDWCQATDSNPTTTDHDTLGSTPPGNCGSFERIGVRYSLEFRQKTPHGNDLTGSNLQSFLVAVVPYTLQ